MFPEYDYSGNMNVSYYQKEIGIFSVWKRTDHSLSSWEACQVDEEIEVNGKNYWETNFSSI